MDRYAGVDTYLHEATTDNIQVFNMTVNKGNPDLLVGETFPKTGGFFFFICRPLMRLFVDPPTALICRPSRSAYLSTPLGSVLNV